MSKAIGWALVAAAFAVGWLQWGWRGLALALTVTVFWMLLQFNRALRTLRNASGRPVGTVPNAVMFHSKLQAGMRMPQVLALTGSLGQRLSESEDFWAWTDRGGDRVELRFTDGRLAHWGLHRAESTPPARS